jgi:2-dehydropantoate 2-reductase
MREMEAIANRQEIHLPPEIVEESYIRGHDFPPDVKTSFQRDFERMDKPDERDLFAGTIIRMGAQCDVSVPATTEVLAPLDLMKPLRR